jgi:dihydrodipicolinate synthase/N-acetylneuraminate lyase
MNTESLTLDAIKRSVLAVPPLARNTDLTLNRAENEKMVRHIEQGGVSTLLYGGNANLYNIAVSEYAALLEMLADIASDNTRVIPSVGPAYGTMMDQAAILREADFPTAMILPQHFGSTTAGTERGVRDFAEAFGRPVILYIKAEGLIDVAQVAQLANEGLLSAIKYAIVRDDPARDDYLRELTDVVDRRMIISGIGEQPAVVHLRDFGLGGFTSGCVCVAPRLSANMLSALRAGDYERAELIRKIFEPLEDLRNNISPIRVLHDAVALAGIADTGPILPLLSNVEASHRSAIEKAATELLAGASQCAAAAEALTEQTPR